MKTLGQLRTELGEFQYPLAEELWPIVEQINLMVDKVLRSERADTKGFHGRAVKAARHDLAGFALSVADEYPRKVKTFRDLTLPELEFVVGWVAGCRIVDVLKFYGWLPQPEPYRIRQLLDEDPDIPPRTRKRLQKRFLG